MRKTLLAGLAGLVGSALAGVMTPAHAGYDWYAFDFLNGKCSHGFPGVASPAALYQALFNAGLKPTLKPYYKADGTLRTVVVTDGEAHDAIWFPSAMACLNGLPVARAAGIMPDLDAAR